MRLAYLSRSSLPSRSANSVHVMKMCQAFAKSGHDVVLLAPNAVGDRSIAASDPYHFYGVDPCFEILKLPHCPEPGPRYGMVAALAAMRLKPDLVYCRYLLGCLAATAIGLRTRLEMHSPFPGGVLKNAVFSRLVRSPKFEALIVITRALADHYSETTPSSREKLLVAADGADAVASVAPVELSPNTDRLQIGYLGSLHKGKGIEVVEKLAGQCPWADFHIFGGGPLEVATWQGRCQARNVVFHGHVPHRETPNYISAFDIALLPNQDAVLSHEGSTDIGQWTSPLKLFEYMACGVPIVASDIPVLREVLAHEQNALLCRATHIEDWKRCLERLRDDDSLRQHLGQAARSQLAQKYTWAKRASRVLAEVEPA